MIQCYIENEHILNYTYYVAKLKEMNFHIILVLYQPEEANNLRK